MSIASEIQEAINGKKRVIAAIKDKGGDLNPDNYGTIEWDDMVGAVGQIGASLLVSSPLILTDSSKAVFKGDSSWDEDGDVSGEDCLIISWGSKKITLPNRATISVNGTKYIYYDNETKVEGQFVYPLTITANIDANGSGSIINQDYRIRIN